MISTKGLARAVVAAMVLLAAGAVQAVVIETVPVGNPNNAADTRYVTTGYGAVAYTYNIGKYEVTAGQYTAFLNAVAATDTYELYNTGMDPAAYSYACNILRSGLPGSYTYRVVDGWADRPVNCVSLADAMRFANWLHNGQQGAGTTEYGAYTLTSDGIANNTISRNTGVARWAVTSEDEWYKAAYYDPNKGGIGVPGYWNYPTGSDTAPGRDMADPLPGNNANYNGTPLLPLSPIDSGKYTTIAGEFQNSDSPYGTFDQGGNLWEWNETIINDINGSYRGLRGGAFLYADYTLLASMQLNENPAAQGGSTGFRVSELSGPISGPIPEPVTMAGMVLGIGGLVGYIRRRMAR